MSDSPDDQNPFAARVDAAMQRMRGAMPTPATARREIVTGLSTAVGGVPDGMAGGVLAGVNPIYGLYAAMVGPLVGALFASTQLLRVTSTSASALAAGAAISFYAPDERAAALFLLVVIVGLLQIVAGALRLGRFTNFVSHSVMVGFLSGIALLIVLGQLPTFAGYAAVGRNKIAETFDLLANLGQIDLRSLSAGVLALALAIGLPRTRAGPFAALIALAIPSALVALLRWDGVALVRDVGEITRGLPMPALPALRHLSLELISGAFAIAAVILVQGAGVAQSVRNPDGRPSSPSRDFMAQGFANLAVGLCQGVPVGGSVNQTAFSVMAGARTRWTNIFSGLWMAAILLLIPGLVGYVAMPALAALLIIAGWKTIKLDEALSIWRTGWPSRLAILTTFTATLFLPVQAAVGIGAALSALLYLNEASTDITVVEFVAQPGGAPLRRKPPRDLPSDTVTVLHVNGSLFYAGARTLERLLPAPRGATRPVVVLRLWGRTSIGATLVDVLARYADDLRAAGGRLYLSGVSAEMRDQLVRTGKIGADEDVQIYLASEGVGDATRQAVDDASAWLARRTADAPASQRPDELLADLLSRPTLG